MPYWIEDDSNKSAKVKLAGVVALTLGTTGVRHVAPKPLLNPHQTFTNPLSLA